MTTLKYKIIKNKIQYKEYSVKLEELVFSGSKEKNDRDEIELLTFLIEKWDDAHNSFHTINPIQLLQSCMVDHEMKAKDLVELLEVSKGYVSDILNYKKGLSKDVIRKLSLHFKISQEAFNRPYKLVVVNKIQVKAGKSLNLAHDLQH